MKKKYWVDATMIVDGCIEVEAASKEEALALAQKLWDEKGTEALLLPNSERLELDLDSVEEAEGDDEKAPL